MPDVAIRDISLAIDSVCGPNKSRVGRARERLEEYSNNIPKLLSKLDKLCGGSFLLKAKLNDFGVTEEAIVSIDGSLNRQGNYIPLYITIKTSTGSSNINTGTLGSFYSCESLEDTSPTLIATGSSSLTGRASADQKCNNWSYKREWALSGSYKIHSDRADPHVYVSTSSTGNCYDAVGSLVTQTVGITDSRSKLASLPSMKVNCADSTCTTEATLIEEGYWDINYLIPSVSVTCADISCTTSPITTSSYTQLLVPSQSVICTSFPCSLEAPVSSNSGGDDDYYYYDDDDSNSNNNIPERSISGSNNVYSTNAVSSTDNNYYIPSQSVTCSDTACSTDELLVEPKSLIIPEQSTICTGTSCDSIPSTIITDSTGTSITIPVRSITCNDHLCTAESVSATQSGYTYYSPSQNIICEGESCTAAAQVLYAGASSHITIPSLIVGSIASTAGSLYSLCMRETDH
jgi:hypothetical protein